MTVLEKIAKINKVELFQALLETTDLVVAQTSGGLLVSVNRPDEEGDNWETQIISL